MNSENKSFGKASDTAKPKRVPKSPSEALQPKDAPPPPKRAKQAKSGIVVVLNSIMSLLVFVAVIACVGFYFGKSLFETPGPLKEQRTMQITEGESLGTIAKRLQDRDIISNSLVFRTGVHLYRASSNMQVGEYVFQPGMSMRDVMETIRSGKGILYKLSIPEGWTNHQIYKRVAETAELTGDMPEMVEEGDLMPDTYPFVRGTTRRQIIRLMERARTKFVKQIWDKRVEGLPLKTPEEMVILASIVEKETAKADERPRVASVFINRLRKGMKLQSDPTIIYGIYGGEGKPSDKPITRSDIDKPTPYNTYVIDALPPTPIGNPGRASLEAVANPSRTEDYYFVADGTGGHVFAKTLEEHQANVRRWRNIEKRLKMEADKRAKSDGEEKKEPANTN